MPSRYYIEYWKPTSIGFVVALKEDLKDGAAIAEEMALKHKFSIADAVRGSAGYYAFVPWLDPQQVAALRCERAVAYIEFEHSVVMPVTPNISLERSRDR